MTPAEGGSGEVSEKVQVAGLWRFPPNSRKAHFFPGEEIISLCRGWMFSGPGQGDADSPPSRDDCTVCRRKLDRLRDSQ